MKNEETSHGGTENTEDTEEYRRNEKGRKKNEERGMLRLGIFKF